MHGSIWNWLMLATPGLYPGIGSESGRTRGEPGLQRGALGLTVAKSLKPVCHGGVPVQPGGVLVKPRFVPEWPGVAPVTHGLGRIIPVYHGRAKVESRFVPMSSWFYPVFDNSPGWPRFALVVLNIWIQSGRFSGLPRFPVSVCHGRATVLSRFVTVHPGYSGNIALSHSLHLYSLSYGHFFSSTDSRKQVNCERMDSSVYT